MQDRKYKKYSQLNPSQTTQAVKIAKQLKYSDYSTMHVLRFGVSLRSGKVLSVLVTDNVKRK